MGWTLIFSLDGSVQTFHVDGDPQEGAADLCRANPWLNQFAFIAAVAGGAQVLVADDARTAEYGLQGWP